MPCQSFCNKYNEISGVVKDMDLRAPINTDTWLAGNISDLPFIDELIPAGYLLYHAARIHKKGGASAFLCVIL